MYMHKDLYCHHLLQLERYMNLEYSNDPIYFIINSPTYLFLALIMLILDGNGFSMLCSSMKKSDQMLVYKHRNELDHKIYNLNAKFGTYRYVSLVQVR